MKKQLFCAAVSMAATAALYAAPEITINSTPALPTANCLKESTFAAGKLNSWNVAAANRDLVVADSSESSDKNSASLKITGNAQRSPNAYHRVNPAVPFKKGSPYLLRFSSKRSGGTSAKSSGGTAMSIYAVDAKKDRYCPVPEQPRFDYDWTWFEHVDQLPIDAKKVTIYLCYYNQSGSIWFDQLELKIGTVDLAISVKGGGLQEVVVRNSVIGTVLKEKVSGNEFAKTITVPAFGSYAVEVLDRTGETTSKLYPANEDANVAAGESVIPLTPVKRVILKPESSDAFSFALPALAGKKVYLEFNGRIHKKSGLAGYTNCLKIKVNGKNIGVNEVVKPGKVVVLANKPQRKVNICNSVGYILFYHNSFMALPEKNSYCPISFEDRNPFGFKLDITRQVEEGLNMLNLHSVTLKNMDIYLEDLRVVIE